MLEIAFLKKLDLFALVKFVELVLIVGGEGQEESLIFVGKLGKMELTITIMVVMMGIA